MATALLLLCPTVRATARCQLQRHFRSPSTRGCCPVEKGHRRTLTTLRNDTTKAFTLSFHHQVVRYSSSRSGAELTHSTTTTTTTTLETTSEERIVQGEEWYQRALEAFEQSTIENELQKQKHSEQIQQALEKAQKAERDHKTQGVVVVKTIAKQARKRRQQRLPNGDEDVVNEEDNDLANVWKKRAMQYLEKAGNEYDHPIALVQLGTMALEEAKKQSKEKTHWVEDDGTNLKQQKVLVQRAMDLFRRAGYAGSRVGWFNLGQLLWTGYPTNTDQNSNNDNEDESTTKKGQLVLPSNADEALDAFTKAIELGDPDAMYFVGVARIQSADGEDDGHINVSSEKAVANEMHSSGLALIREAANVGHGGALYYLALHALEGEVAPSSADVPSATSKEAAFVSFLDRAVLAGNPNAQFMRGHCYYHGSDGYDQNYVKALQDFLQAAEEGSHADAAVSAGAMLHNGIGNIIPPNQQHAFQLYQQAGEWGSREGWQNVVACYLSGEGVPQSIETAKYIAETMLQTKLDLT